MSRHKGKAKRRMKDLHRQYSAGLNVDDTLSRQRVMPHGVKLPTWRLPGDQENLESLPRAEGMVAGMFPGGAIVRSEGKNLLCGIAKTFRAPEGASAIAVGDIVSVAITREDHTGEAAGGDKVRADGMILSRRTRKTVLARPRPMSSKRRDEYDDEKFDKVIAANMDSLLIVASMRQPALRRMLVDRFLIIAERGDLRPVLVLTKIDLLPADEETVNDFESLGLTVFPCSAVTGEGIESLRAAVTGRESVLAGLSGVGKSTLVNALVPGAEVLTRTVRMQDERGRHTTAATTVYPLPGGGVIIDTPGLRELGMDMAASELPWYFPDFDAYAPACRFNDCTHTVEPQCAVVAAVEAGKIQPRRYESYLRIRETLK